MKIAIVGGGVAGLSAAYDLLASGHAVTVFEAGEQTGGLAAGFKDTNWQWPLEKYYHHLFTSDKHIIALAEELGIKEELFFPRPITSVIYNGQIEPFDSPKAWIRFPGFNLLDVGRFGLVSAYLRFTNPWRSLEQYTADEWLRRWYGDKIYESVWRPLLIGKFGPYYQEVNMAWMWARLKVRSPRLGYFVGGFQAFVDALSEAVRDRGGEIRLSSPVRSIVPMQDERLEIAVESETIVVDRCLVTTSPALLNKMTDSLPESYRSKLLDLKHMGAAVLIIALRRQLLPQTYWLNLPSNSSIQTISIPNTMAAIILFTAAITWFPIITISIWTLTSWNLSS
jgi:protoporphyrinogen oxidase